MSIHKPVLLKESIDYLNLKPGMIVIDATLGGGGHSMEIVSRIFPGGKLIAIDQDKDAIAKFEETINGLKLDRNKENIVLVNDNFANLKNALLFLKNNKVDAIIADLGISSDQLGNTERGFSFQKNSPLDMRMSQEGELTAEKIVNTYGEDNLKKIFSEYGEERNAGKIAAAVIQARKKNPIKTTNELVAIIKDTVPEKYINGKIHFATRIFQALRIEVNAEIENLKKFLSEATEILSANGRLAVISFHSGEDRIVKYFFRENARGCICPPNFPICQCGQKPSLRIVTKTPVLPTPEEVRSNPRARSAKLRVAEKI
jgi:16S rRNA (cytosine1402-N4)-methyltransferase